MTSTDDFAGEWAADIAAAAEAVRPNDLVPPDVLTAMALAFEQATLLTAGEYLLTPFGYPAVPRPRSPQPDGTGRVPAHVAVSYVGNPVWWLDWDTAAKTEDETEWEWAIRLWFECVLRGWWDAEDGEWYDVLAEHGIDPAGPEVAAYLRGEPGTQLGSLVLGTEADVDPKQAMAAARVVVAELTVALADMERDAVVAVVDEVSRARALLADPTTDQAALTTLMRAMQAVETAAKAGQDPTPAVVATRSELTVVLDSVNDVYQAAAFAAVPLLLAASGSEAEYLAAVEALMTAGARQQVQRASATDALLQAIAGAPTDPDRYGALYQEVARMFAVGRQRLAEVIGQVDALGTDGPAVV